MDQPEIWAKITAIKREVQATLGPNIPQEFRAAPVYLNYAGTCGQAQYAYEDGELDEHMLTVVAEQAEKVKAAWQAGEVAGS